MANNEEVMAVLIAKRNAAQEEAVRLQALIDQVQQVMNVGPELLSAARDARVKAVKNNETNPVVQEWTGKPAPIVAPTVDKEV